MKIGRYRIQRQIGEGGQGTVLLGYDPQLRRRVAIKLYRLPDQRESRRQALREARRSALLDSPRITRVHDVLVAGNDLAVIMEYVPGCDLREVLNRTRLSLAATLSVASDVAAALAAARLREMVHGDIKPANILIADTGRAMLTDFGVARVGGDDQAAGFSTSALTPEHVRGDRLAHASDMFALGALIYHMVAGARPFSTGQTGRQAMCEGNFVPLTQRMGDGEVPPALDILVSQLLAPQPQHRPDSIHAVRQALRGIAVALPLGESTPVRAETKNLYRSEGVEDLPSRLAAGFGEASRRRRYIANIRSGVVRHPGTTAACILAGLGLCALAWRVQPAPCAELGPANLRIDPGTSISAGITREWLQRTLRRSIEQGTAGIRTTGELGEDGPRVIGRESGKTRCEADFRLQLQLDCRERLCVASLLRDAKPQGTRLPLFADASPDEWHQAIDYLVGAAIR